MDLREEWWEICPIEEQINADEQASKIGAENMAPSWWWSSSSGRFSEADTSVQSWTASIKQRTRKNTAAIRTKRMGAL